MAPSSSVSLHSVDVKTDELARMSLVGSSYSSVSFKVVNPSSSDGFYRIAYSNSSSSRVVGRTQSTKVGPGAEKVLAVTSLASGAQYDFSLERKEFGEWVTQVTNLGKTSMMVSTYALDAGDVTVSTSSTKAALSWPKTHDSSYKVELYDSSKGPGAKPLVQSEAVTLDEKSQKYRSIFSKLSNKITYRGVISAPGTNGVFAPVASVEFTPSAYATLKVNGSYASYTEFSWDEDGVGKDEEDGEAEFEIRGYDKIDRKWFSVMEMTSDKVKSLTWTKPVPNRDYYVRLRRRSLTDTSVYQKGARYLGVKTSQIKVDSSTATGLRFTWTSAYAGAVYKYSLTPSGGDTAVKLAPRGAMSVDVTKLAPDTEHAFELFVFERGQDVSVGKIVGKTDKSGSLSLSQAKHTVVTLRVDNSSSGEATYYVADESNTFKTGNFKLTGQVSRDVEIRGLSPSRRYKFCLFRRELGRWIKQVFGPSLLDYLTVDTKKFNVSTSVASESALVKWDQAYKGASYELSVYDKAPSSKDGGPKPLQVKADSAIGESSGGKRGVVVSGLAKETGYFGVVTVSEKTASGETRSVVLGQFQFATSAGAVFHVGETRATSVVLSWSAGEVLEEDGIAEFMVTRGKKSSASSAPSAPSAPSESSTAWMPDSVTSLAVDGLAPGKAYVFTLWRKGLDGRKVRQASLDVSTTSALLEVSGTTSTRIQVKWEELYAGARYKLVYTAAAASGSPEQTLVPVTFADGPIATTEALLTDLDPGTAYTLELYVVEKGVDVDLATVALGTAVTVTTGRNKMLIGGIAGVVLLVLVILFVMMR